MLALQGYHHIGRQVRVEPRRSRRQAARRFPGQEPLSYVRFDIVARHPILQTARYVECKRYARPVTSDLVEGFAYRLWLCKVPAAKGIFVAEPSVTSDAERLADQYGIALWEGTGLARRRLVAYALDDPGSIPSHLYRQGLRSGRKVMGMIGL